jgi:hypothetical protein
MIVSPELPEKLDQTAWSRRRQSGPLPRQFARPDKEWSLTDCISFVAMNERNITDALTSDHHFEQAGFEFS